MSPRALSSPQVQFLQTLSDAQKFELQTYLPQLNDLRADSAQIKSVLSCTEDTTLRLIEITRILYDSRENALDSLSNILSSIGEHYAVGLMIHGRKDGCSLYLATRVYSNSYSASTGEDLLVQGMKGHFNGSELSTLSNESARKLLKSYFPSSASGWGVSASVVVPSLKHDDNMTTFTQSLDRFIDAMTGREYTALILAEPLCQRQLNELQQGLEGLATCISPLQKDTITLTESEGENLADTISETLSFGINHSVSKSQSHADTHSLSVSHGHSVSEGTSKSTTNSVNVSITKTIMTGITAMANCTPFGIGGSIGAMLGSSTGTTGGFGKSWTSGTQHTETDTETTTKTTGTTETTTDTEQTGINVQDSRGKSQQVGRNHERSVGKTLEFTNAGAVRFYNKLDEKLDRLDDMRASGAWSAAAFFAAPDHRDAAVAASLYQGMMRGQESIKNTSALLHWQGANAKSVLPWLQQLLLPRFSLGEYKVTPSLTVSSQELALMMCLPRKSVGGVTVLEAVGFGREVRRLNESGFSSAPSKKLPLGKVYHKFQEENRPVHLDMNSLCRHVLVSGTTGVGKSCAMFHILREFHRKEIPFLVIEPAKNEYRDLQSLKGVQVLQAGILGPEGLHLNPFSFPAGSEVSLSSHIDRICAVFNAAFPMYAAMPQILEKAICLAYEEKGWDIAHSRCVEELVAFPSIKDVSQKVEEVVIEAGYTGESRDTYLGALKARLDSFTYGSLGFTLAATTREEETPSEVLFDRPCIVNISNLGSVEKKAVLMGLLLIRLQEQRIVDAVDGIPKNTLRHVTVIEEAHNLLKATNTEISSDSSNPRGQAIEFFANAIGEMRAYGESFFVVDQSASALDTSVLRNTNTKIAFNAPLEEDRAILAGALTLDDLQKDNLARIPSRVAVVKQNDWTEAILCHLAEWSTPPEKNMSPLAYDEGFDERRIQKELFLFLMHACDGKGKELDAEKKRLFHRWAQKNNMGLDLMILRNIIEGERGTSYSFNRLLRKIIKIDERNFASAVSEKGKRNIMKGILLDLLGNRTEVEQALTILSSK